MNGERNTSNSERRHGLSTELRLKIVKPDMYLVAVRDMVPERKKKQIKYKKINLHRLNTLLC